MLGIGQAFSTTLTAAISLFESASITESFVQIHGQLCSEVNSRYAAKVV